MKGSVLLKKIEIRNFTPVTPAGDYVEHKKSLKKIILEKIPNIDELKQKTIGKKLFLDVCFYLNNQTKVEGDTQKDLDNLLPAIFDVLPQSFTDEKNQLIDGLGLIEGKSDYMIFGTNVTKKFVETHEEEGFDLEIFEMVEENASLSKTNLTPKTRKSFNEWLNEKIFPKTNSKQIITTKWIAIWGIVAAAVFTLAGVLIGLGFSFRTLGLAMQVDSITIISSNETNTNLSNFANKLIENGNTFQDWGLGIIALGAIIIIFAIIRER